jgi:hypothetical protein
VSADPPPRFLIDENLSPKLAEFAQSKRYEAAHVRDLGLLKAKDWTLLEVVQDGDWTLVTNNVAEFRTRYRSKVDLHAGVVFLESTDAGRDLQLASFGAALEDIDARPSTINQEILVSPEDRGGFTGAPVRPAVLSRPPLATRSFAWR